MLPLKVSLSSQFEVLRTLSGQQEQVLYWSGPAHLPATSSITMVDVAVGPVGKQPKAYPGLQCLLPSLGWEITPGCRGRGSSKAEPSPGSARTALGLSHIPSKETASDYHRARSGLAAPSLVCSCSKLECFLS